ncbi:MAG: PqiC family protein [Verrucomicrobiota bacterium]|nr:PqiC family protein [Verrucomicrobiota bacterium]
MKKNQSLSLLGASVALVLLLAGCGSKEQYYRLSPSGAAPTGRASKGVSIGIGPVVLPGYLDRAEIVFQNGENEFQIPGNAHWAGSLDENISSVLAADVAQILHSGDVIKYPWPAGQQPPAYQVPVDIRQFHSISGSEAILDVSWRIQTRGGAAGARRNGSFHEPIHGDGYAAVVAAESRLLEQCAAEIARSLRR